MKKLAPGVTSHPKRGTENMYIGWAPMPAIDRRFLIGTLPFALAGTAAVSYGVSSNLSDPGAGSWQTGATHNVTGAWSTHPYPMLRMIDETVPGGVRTVLVVAEGKCSSGLKNDAAQSTPVTASGVLIERKDRQMLEVPPLLDKWQTPADLSDGDLARLRAPRVASRGMATLKGAIMDSKCFFGVMRPARGMTHKACASLCIRGGIPPSFWVRDGQGREAVLLLTDRDGGPMPLEILPLVADPVEARGEIVAVDDILQFRADLSAFHRI